MSRRLSSLRSPPSLLSESPSPSPPATATVLAASQSKEKRNGNKKRKKEEETNSANKETTTTTRDNEKEEEEEDEKEEMKQETIPDDEKKTSTKRTPKKNATPISTKRKKMADNDKPDAPPPTATPSSSIVDADGDVAMVDVDSSQPIPTSDVAPTTQPSPSTTVEDDEEEQKDHDSENDSEFDDDDDENGINSDLYQPQLNSTPELCDPSDRFGSFDQRSDYMLHRLSPLYIPTTMPGYESPSKDLTDLLTRTMTSSINNAALILGPHGSGCTSLLEMCLRKLRKEFIMKGKSFVEVRLNGNVQTDDTLAMREIVFQVCRDHELEHLKDSADFHAHLNFLIEILNQGTFHETPILFILDEFHLFTQRTKQTLLYNLCDLLQSQKAQLCLVGLSSHYNCYERLEKRIRSRMSHRRIILGPPIEMVRHGGGGGGGDGVDDGEMIEKSYNLQKSETLKMEHIIQILKDRLIIPIDEKVNGTGASASASSSTALTPSHPPSPAILAHNASITRLLSRTDSPRLHALLAFFQLHRMQIGTFFKIFTFGIQSSLNMYHPNLLEEDIVHAFQYWRKDWIKEGLKHCTVLELTLLTSMVHLSRQHITYQNFTQIYQSYLTFHKRHSIGNNRLKCFEEMESFIAFENLLQQQHLLVWSEQPPSTTTNNQNYEPSYTGTAIQRRFRPVKLLLSQHEFQQAIKQRWVKAPTWLVLWAANRNV